MDNPMARLADIADRQSGQVTVLQADFADIPNETIATALDLGIAEWVVPQRVLRIRGGACPPCPRVLAAWLLLEATPAWERTPPDCGVVSHRSALALYGLPAFPGPQYEFTVPVRCTAASDDIVLHVAVLGDMEWREVAGLPVTTPVRTLQDFAALPGVDDEDLGKVAARFRRHGLADEDDLAVGLAAHLRSVGATGSGAEWLRRLFDAAR